MTQFKHPRLQALKGQAQRDIQVLNTPQGLLEEVTPKNIQTQLQTALTNEGIGQLLQQARKKRGLSLRAAAQASGRSASRVVAIEKTGADMKISTLVQMAQALEYDIEVRLIAKKDKSMTLETMLGQH
jgi:ribosome-binding protein aMBF1 (putative translation factor)